MKYTLPTWILILTLAKFPRVVVAFSVKSTSYGVKYQKQRSCMLYIASPSSSSQTEIDDHSPFMERRLMLQMFSLITAALPCQSSFAASKSKLDILRSQVMEARSQLDQIPQLIKEEKWDSIRAILITPPLSDCWSKTSKLLNNYAVAVGDEVPGGDELAALELKEEALDHLRFLDMAVYNNVFNPIKTEGESGATKTLIRSYYEDPVNEYNACVRVFDGLIELSNN